MLRCMDPAHIPGAPVNRSPSRGNPAPATVSQEDPSPVVIGSPAPAFNGNPDIIPADPYPSAVMVGRPVYRNRDRRSPDVAIAGVLEPSSVIVKIVPVVIQLLGKVAEAVSGFAESSIQVAVPFQPFIAGTERIHFCLQILSDPQRSAGRDTNPAVSGLGVRIAFQHGNLRCAVFFHIDQYRGHVMTID